MSGEKYRRETGLFLAEGFKVVQELLKSAWTAESIVIMADRVSHYRGFLAELAANIPVYSLPAADWRKLSQDKNPEGIMAVAAHRHREDPDPVLMDRGGHLLFLYRINNPNNLGAIMRAAHWFGFGKLAIGAGSVDYTNPKVVRTAMGSLFHLDIFAVPDAHDFLNRIKKNYFLAATTPSGGINPHPGNRPTALIMGSESHGLPADILELADERWTVPGSGEAESLSLPQAAAIAMYELTKGKAGRK